MGKPPAPRDANGMKSTKSRTALARKEIEASLLSLQKLGPDSLHPQSSLAPLDLETYFMDSDDLIPTQWHVASFYSPGSSTNGSSDVAIAPTSLFDHDLKFLEEAKPNLLAPRASTDDMFVFDDICIDLGPSKSNGTFTSLDGTTGQTIVNDSTPTYGLEHLRGVGHTSRKPISTHFFDRPILINNKSAIENVRSLLACPCSLSPQYALTIALIIHNILVCYEAIIRATSNVRAEPGNTIWPENLRATPITVGAYKIDAEDDQRMRIQLMVNELRKVRALVEKYAERYCVGKEDEVPNAGIYSALDIFLQTKLKQAVSDMVSTLRG
ncbi:hypothetical protein ACLOAV_006716 [Pseudogymnoascus australis]